MGPMFSGKSTELIRRIKRHRVAQQECVIIKYSKDQRYSQNGVSTHDRQEAEALPCCVLAEVEPQMEHCGVIGIDEGQFVRASAVWVPGRRVGEHGAYSIPLVVPGRGRVL